MCVLQRMSYLKRFSFGTVPHIHSIVIYCNNVVPYIHSVVTYFNNAVPHIHIFVIHIL